MGKIIRILAAACLLAIPATSEARLHERWDYKGLAQEAEFIVIAVPVKEERLNEVGILPNIHPEIKATGIITTFLPIAILRGILPNAPFKLHHYSLSPGEVYRNGPGLVNFDLDKKYAYLMFLKKEGDNQFVALSGQTDPDEAIKQLCGEQFVGISLDN